MTSQPLPPGTRVGRYEVVTHLASGGMGQVYRARDVELEREVALKVLPVNLAANAAAVERFRREARLAARLSHKNIVTLYDWGQDSGTWFLALEFIDGIDLHTHITARGRLDAQEAWLITVQAARALDHAFGQGVTHRDIKPSNFLLTRQGRKVRVKLTDLGLARTAQEEEFRITRDGSTVGTIDYLAPEQARDSALADVRSDIYSLGCTLYHMLAGRPPFPEGGLAERVLKHLEAEPPDVRQFNPEVPDGLWAVLRRMLAKRPDDRFQTPADLLDALLRLNSCEPSTAGGPVQVDGDSGVSIPASAGASESAVLSAMADHPPPPTMVAPPTSAEVPGISAEQRQAAAARFEGAREVLATDKRARGEAYELLLDCCRLDPAQIPYRRALRRLGQELCRRGELDRVPSLPTAADAGHMFEAARQAGASRQVLEHGELVLVHSPQDVATHLGMAEAAARLNLAHLHVWLLKQACKQEPGNVDLLRRLARAHEQYKELGKAIAVWRVVRKGCPHDSEAATRIDAMLRVLARAYQRQNDRDSAVAVWQALLKLRPQDSEAARQISALSLNSTVPGGPNES
jgi:serine/threonine-protein kinase